MKKPKTSKSTWPKVHMAVAPDYHSRLKNESTNDNRNETNYCETLLVEWLDGKRITIAEAKEALLKIIKENQSIDDALKARPRGLLRPRNTNDEPTLA